MRYYLFVFALLLAIMMLLPMCRAGEAPPPAQDARAARSSTPDASTSTPPDASTLAPDTSSAPATASSAPETAQAQKPPLSNAAALRDSVLLYDRATDRVVKMTQQEYVLGAVCSEMPPSFHPEAVKSQAVAAHSYLLRCKQQEEKSPNPALKGAYLQIDTAARAGYVSEAVAREQYGARFELYYGMMRDAVRAVEDQILVYSGQPIVAAYHAISAGKTEDASNVWVGSADYLVPVESPGDRLAPDYETQETFTMDETASRLRTALPGVELPGDPAAWFGDVERSDSGYITALRLGGEEMTGLALRELFELRSSDLDIAYQNGAFTFKATGYGHGVGLSQYGADYMARQGADYQGILAHYYTGAKLVRIQ